MEHAKQGGHGEVRWAQGTVRNLEAQHDEELLQELLKALKLEKVAGELVTDYRRLQNLARTFDFDL